MSIPLSEERRPNLVKQNTDGHDWDGLGKKNYTMRENSFDSFAKLDDIVNNSQIELIESTSNLESP